MASDNSKDIKTITGTQIREFSIKNGETFKLENSTYNIFCDIFISAGGKLILENATLLFEKSRGIMCEGVLCSNGSKLAPRSAEDGWNNLTITGAGTSGTSIINTAFERASGAMPPAACSNGSEISGGAILLFNTEKAAITIKNSKFENCMAKNNGGAICCQNSNPEIETCNFTNCSVIAEHSSGGAICCYRSHPKITGCVFIECSSGSGNFGMGGGGAINCNEANPEIYNATFEKCRSFGHGGAISCYNESSPVIECSTFDGCYTESKHAVGGAIFGDYLSAPKIMNSAFTGCNSKVRGGAMCFSNKCRPVVENCKFESCSNTSREYGVGGAIYVYNSNITIRRCAFKACANFGRGGAIYCDYKSESDIENCEFTNCSCKDFGGAIYYDMNCPTKITGPFFEGCKPNSVNHESHAENRMPQNVKKIGSSSGQCFIATAAYGSYMEPEVVVLRNFRDDFLMGSIAGRAFVKAYYKLSPPAAEFIKGSEKLKAAARILLAPIVAMLRKRY